MSSVIAIGCGLGAMLCGVTLYATNFKGIRNAMNNWLKSIISLEGSENGGNGTNETAVDVELEEVEYGITTEFPVMDENTGERFIFLTIVRPPADNNNTVVVPPQDIPL